MYKIAGVMVLLGGLIIINLILNFIGIKEYEAIHLQGSNEPALLAGNDIIVESSIGVEHPTETIFISNLPNGRVIKPSLSTKLFLNKNPGKFPIAKHDSNKNIWVDLSSVGKGIRHLRMKKEMPKCKTGVLYWIYDTQIGFYSGKVDCAE